MRQNRWRIGFVSVCILALLLAAGCTGTDFLDSGNSTVAFEIVSVGSSNIAYDCVQWGFGGLVIRPLDGTCGPTSLNVGDACLNVSDCTPLPGQLATCENSAAGELLIDDGIFVRADPSPGNILGGECNPTIAAGGVCEGLFPETLCTDGSDCGSCEQDRSAPCNDDADCNPPNDLCIGQAPCVNLFKIRSSALIAPESLILSAGVYEISEIEIGSVGVYEDVPQPPLVPPGPHFRGCANGFFEPVADLYGDALRFKVPENQSKVIRFEIDVGALEANLPGEDDCTGVLGNITSIMECVSCDAAP